MDSKRQQKIGRLIQKDLGEIFQIELRSIFSNVMITVTNVKISSDLSIAKVFLSVFSLNNANKEDVLTLIRENANDIRRRLGIREHNQLRIIPNIHFYLDDSLDYIENINMLLKQ